MSILTITLEIEVTEEQEKEWSLQPQEWSEYEWSEAIFGINDQGRHGKLQIIKRNLVGYRYPDERD